MAILMPTKISGSVSTVLVNGAPDKGIATSSVGSVDATFEGLAGDWHSTLVRDACERTRRQYVEGTPIRNTRQITIVSEEDMAIVAENMGLEAVKPDWLGANLLVSGIQGNRMSFTPELSGKENPRPKPPSVALT